MKTRLTDKEYKRARLHVLDTSSLDLDFFVLILFASIICFLGFVMNSPTVIIGAMVISPLLYPIVGLAESIVSIDFKHITKMIAFLVLDLAIILLTAMTFSYFSPIDIKDSEIVSRLAETPSLYFAVAFCCGLAGAFGFFWPKVRESVIGVGISVALVPPAVMFGAALASYHEIVFASGMILLMNLSGILVGSTLMILLLKHSRKRNA